MRMLALKNVHQLTDARTAACALAVPAALPQTLHCAPLPSQAKASRAYGRAGAIAGEAVSNMRTVAAFGREEAVLRSYASALAAPTKVHTRVAVAWRCVCGVVLQGQRSGAGALVVACTVH